MIESPPPDLGTQRPGTQRQGTAPGPPWSIEEMAVCLGGYVWVESRLFEVLGALVSTPGRVGVVALAHAAHSAWHAGLWRSRIPILPHLSPGSVIVAPTPEVEAVLSSCDTSSMNADVRAALVGIYRVVLPGLLDVYGQHLARAMPVTDGPVIRTLELILADEQRDLSEGEALLGTGGGLRP